MDSPPLDAQSSFPPPTGLALASLVLGIAAVGLSFLIIGVLSGIIGLVLGLVYLSKKRGPTGMARWGVGLSIFGILASLGFFALYYYSFKSMGLGLGSVGSATTINVTVGSVSPLPASPSPLKSNLLWTASMPGAMGMCAGDWPGGGSPSVLVAVGTSLHVLDFAGHEKSIMGLPESFTSIECGRDSTGPLLLGYSPWGGRAAVMNPSGKTIWTPRAITGLDGAHWGDVDGNGNDDLVLGMNGFGGLALYSSDVKKLWSAGLANVWNQAIIPPSSNRPAMILATDAGGSVNIFDKTGTRLNILHPATGYYAEMAAGATESNAVQILGFSGTTVEAFDLAGKPAWITSALTLAPNGRPGAVLGDFGGDGAKEWAFVDGGGDMVLATASGQKACAIAGQNRIQGLAVGRRPGQGDLLLVLDAGMVRAYSFSH